MPRHPARTLVADDAPARRLPLVLLLVALVCAALVTVPARPAAAQGAGTSTILSQVNASRAAAGLRPLALSGDLSAVAYAWSRHLASSGVLAHNPNLTGQVGDWQVLGENVGYGPTVSDVETAFMNSPHHRANILEPRYTQIGLGVVADSSGTVWVTQVFRTPMSSAGTSSATTPSRATSSSTPRRTTSTSSRPARSGSSAARAGTAAPAHPSPAPRVTAPARPDPGTLLAQRLAAAQARAHAAGDPITDALGWAAAMDAVAG